MQQMPITGADNLGASRDCRGNHKVIIGILCLHGRRRHRSHDEGRCLHSLEVCLDPRVVQSVQGTDARVLKDTGQLSEERSGGDQGVR